MKYIEAERITAEIDKIIEGFSNALYSYILIILLVGGGIFFTIKSKFYLSLIVF